MPKLSACNPALHNVKNRSYIHVAVVVALLALLVAASSGLYFGFPIRAVSTCSCRSDGGREDAQFTGMVEGCCCDYATVNSLNDEIVHSLLQRLVRTAFFRYFKVKLWCDCPHWPNDGMCRLRDCSVCECPDDEFPAVFKGSAAVPDGNRFLQEFGSSLPDVGPTLLPSDSLICQEGKPQSVVDRTLDYRAFSGGWIISRDNPWTFDDETDDKEISYVNLLLNSERFTGYTGVSARRIWDAIYQDNIALEINEAKVADYKQTEELLQAKFLYKLVSGLHSSISIHVAADFLLDETTNHWGPNNALLYDRVLNHPSRVRNLYFAYLFVLRAVTKAADYLLQADYNTGNPAEDEITRSLMIKLVSNKRMNAACPKPFDEAQLWRGADGGNLLLHLQRQFQNISSLMDCVGCEKCRLWGKLQILGLGTALDILLSQNSSNHYHPLLHRNEVIALINLLHRLSESLHFLHNLSILGDPPETSHHLSFTVQPDASIYKLDD